MNKSQIFWIYMLECINSHYYTGYTDDLVKRYRQHVSGKGGSKYTRSFKPVKIAQCWKLSSTKGNALRVEKCIKGMNRLTKLELIDNPDMLKKMMHKELDLKLDIIPYNPEIFEKLSTEN